MSESAASAAPTSPTDIPELFGVHSAESWAREIIAHAIQVAHNAPAPSGGQTVAIQAEVLVSAVGDGLGITLRFRGSLHCVRVGR